MADILRHAACEVLLSDKAPLFPACQVKTVMLGWMEVNFLFIKA